MRRGRRLHSPTQRAAARQTGAAACGVPVADTLKLVNDNNIVEKSLARYAKQAKSGGDKEAQRLVAVLEKARAQLDQAKPVRTIDFSKMNCRC